MAGKIPNDGRPKGWLWTHEAEMALIARDGWMCEKHPGQEWPHDDCPGPGMAWIVKGKKSIKRLLRGR